MGVSLSERWEPSITSRVLMRRFFPGCPALANEPIFLPVAPHSEGCEFPLGIEKYRGMVEEALFDRLGRPSFFCEAVDLILGRIAAGVGQQGSANGKSTSCAFAPQESWIREALSCEARQLKRGIEIQFMKTRRLELPAEDCNRVRAKSKFEQQRPHARRASGP